MAFERTFQVSWTHLDAMGHMSNTAYLDAAVDVRFMYFTEHGFPPSEFVRLKLGPVARRDEVDYYRELRLLDKASITLRLAGLSEDASRYRFRNEVYRADGELSARITSLGGWLDLAARKLVAPPEALRRALRNLEVP